MSEVEERSPGDDERDGGIVGVELLDAEAATINGAEVPVARDPSTWDVDPTTPLRVALGRAEVAP